MCLPRRYNRELLLGLQVTFGVVIANADISRASSLCSSWTRNLNGRFKIDEALHQVRLLARLGLIHRRLACLTCTTSSHFRTVLNLRPSSTTTFHLDRSVHGAYTTQRFRSLSKSLEGVLDARLNRWVSKGRWLANITWLIQICHKVCVFVGVWWLWQDLAFDAWAFHSVRSFRWWWW